MTLYKFAGFWRRLVAYAIDHLIINFVFFTLLTIILIAFFAGALSSGNFAWARELLDREIVSLSLLSALFFYIAMHIFYFTYFHGIDGQTPGKMLLNIKVISIDGAPVTFGTAFLRSVGYLISSIFCLGFVWVAFDRRKQGWHDKIALTNVIIRSRLEGDVAMVAPVMHSSPALAENTEGQTETISPQATELLIPKDYSDESNIGQHNKSDQKIP